MASQQLSLARGVRIKARVVELQAGNELLVAYQGHFLRVKNYSDRVFKKDDVLNLQVVGTVPLEFRIIERNEASFDRLI